MILLNYASSEKLCPCGAHLKAYATPTRRVKSARLGVFQAREHIKCCSNGHPQRLFRSEELSALVGKGRIYANDVMVDAANQRYLYGRSGSEIAQLTLTGISERHARRLAREALDVVKALHEEKSAALTAAMGRWVLQIDGIVDGEYDMIVAVRDALSGFLLYAKTCHFETHDEIRTVLAEVKKRYGAPCATISDLRAGILSALAEDFPGVPVAICRYHFLRDLGKDLLKADHVSLGKIFTTYGIRALLKRVLRSLPEYDLNLLVEVGNGICSDPKELAVMECRRELERILWEGEKSGLGFPFTLRQLNFLWECVAALPILAENNRVAQNAAIEEAVSAIREVVSDAQVIETGERLKEVYGLFGALKGAMYPKTKGTPLSGEPSLTDREAQGRCREVVAELEKVLMTMTAGHVSWTAKKIVTDYGKWESHLFPSGVEGIAVPKTNNRLEQVFRRMRRNVRKRCGDKATGRQLTLTGEMMLLYQNLANPAYVEAVFGEESVATVFGRKRASLPKVRKMGRKERERLLDQGQQMLRKGQVPGTPYTEEMFAEVQRQVVASSELYPAVRLPI